MNNNIEITTFGVSDVGNVRTENQDTIYFDPIGNGLDLKPHDYLLLIADGMGGHQGGGVASKTAVGQVCSELKAFGTDVHAALTNAFLVANQRIYADAQKDTSLNGMGTTCTALLLREGNVYCAHVGDSRAYLLRNDALYRMTVDHTVLSEHKHQAHHEALMEDPELAASLLTRALGTFPMVKVDTWAQGLPVQENDMFILCTDGLYDLVEDHEIKEAMMSYPLDTACNQLVKLSKQRGGHDNVSIVSALITYRNHL